jgi:predicted ATPase/class 3 adenylate cyclase/DNA-binding CsgD family transcriptional regulator
MSQLPTGTVTLLFTDIEGSTLLLQQLGERYASALIECRDLLRSAFSEHHGYEVDTQGDGFFVVFVRAREAMLATVAAQHALTTHSWPEGVGVRVRMGLHTGEPSLVGEGYVGLDVHYAARIMHAAHGGQVLLSQTTHDLIEHELPFGVSLRDLRKHRLKDLQRPAHLYQLVIVGLPADFPPLKTLDNSPNNLPVQPTSLIGREKEVATLLNLLQREEVRLLTLTGPGGSGKTRLGLQVAAELSDLFPDGVFFVNLAPLSDPALVVPTIAQMLGVKEAAGQPLLDSVSASLQMKELLLLLDNFEQVVEAAVEVATLLARCPMLNVLVTSRAVLHVRGEQEFPVPPLAVPDPKRLPDLVALSRYEAVELFLSRAQAVKPVFQLSNTNAPAIAEICARLDGLPLAIELAAARIKLLPPQALLVRLGQRLTVLTGGAQDAPVRQQTLRNTIDWSYDLLEAQEQRLFRWLCVFVGGCTLEAIEAVCTTLDTESASWKVLDGVASLIDKSLLQQTEQESNELRLVMLETIREYGLNCLAINEETEATRHAHALYFLALAEQFEAEFGGPQQNIATMRLERERENLRIALQWLIEQGEREMALRLSSSLWWFWRVSISAGEGLRWLEQALLGSDGVQESVQAKALYTAGKLALFLFDIIRAAPLAEESLKLYQELGDKHGIAGSLMILGEVASLRGNFAAAFALNEESLAIFKALEDREGIADALLHRARMSQRRGDYAKAIEYHEGSLELFRDLGDKEGIADVLNSLGYVTSLGGDYARARVLLQESLELSREVGDRESIGDSLYKLAQVAFAQGDPAAASSLLEESLAIVRVGDMQNIVVLFSLLGEVILSQGDIARAQALFEETMVLSKEAGVRQGVARSLSNLAKVEAHQGDHATARALYQESLAIANELGLKLLIASCLEGLASVVAAQGESRWAALLWGAAVSLRDTMGVPLPPVYRAAYERSVAAARTQLGEQAFAAVWAEGRMVTPEQALAAQGKAIIPTWPTSVTPTKSPTISPGGLSARELEVLRLLATGLTDAQIAEQLVLSLHTIHAHLRTIYSKLGVTSRSAATRYAFEHQLV